MAVYYKLEVDTSVTYVTHACTSDQCFSYSIDKSLDVPLAITLAFSSHNAVILLLRQKRYARRIPDDRSDRPVGLFGASELPSLSGKMCQPLVVVVLFFLFFFLF